VRRERWRMEVIKLGQLLLLHLRKYIMDGVCVCERERESRVKYSKREREKKGERETEK
jgi:hypothetical protein